MSQYIHAGIFLITVPNLIVIALMVAGFIIAIAVQLPHPPAEVPGETAPLDSDTPANTPATS